MDHLNDGDSDYDDEDFERCDHCDDGVYVFCIDDLCQSDEGCIHGDGEGTCPYCHGTGRI